MVSIFFPCGEATWVVKLKPEDCSMSVGSEHRGKRQSSSALSKGNHRHALLIDLPSRANTHF